MQKKVKSNSPIKLTQIHFMSLKIKNQRHKVMTLLPVFPSSLQIALRRLRTQATTTQPTSRQEETLLLEECRTRKVKRSEARLP